MKPLLPLTLLLTAAACGAMKLNAPRIYINGLPLRQPSIVKDGVTYVPLRAVSEALGCTVDYNPRSGIFIWGNQQQSPSPFATPDPNAPSSLPLPACPATRSP